MVLGAESKHLGLGEMYPCVSLGVGEDAASSVPRAAGRSQLLQEQQLLGLFSWVLLALWLRAKRRNLRWSRLSVCETGVPAPPERREG